MSYPRTVNGWELADTDTMRYTKQTDEGHAFIDITWIDQTREDPDYGTEESMWYAPVWKKASMKKLRLPLMNITRIRSRSPT